MAYSSPNLSLLGIGLDARIREVLPLGLLTLQVVAEALCRGKGGLVIVATFVAESRS